MTLLIQGQPVERVVVHGSEETLWELFPSGETGLSMATPSELLGIAERIEWDFDHVHNMEPYSTKGILTDTVAILMSDRIEPFGSTAGFTDTVQIFINDEEMR
jgi:hypothetical protein